MEKHSLFRFAEQCKEWEVTTLLFRNKIVPSCAYCSHGRCGAEEEVLCVYHGVMNPWDKCRRFDYDPLRRVPEADPLPLTDVDPASFDL